jgi:hypothetical protein
VALLGYQHGIALWRADYPDSSVVFKHFHRNAATLARHEVAGLRLADTLGFAPALLRVDETLPELGEMAVIYEYPDGAPLLTGITDEQINAWVFLLLTLQHLPLSPDTPVSPSCADAPGWWERTRLLWRECRGRYASSPFEALISNLGQIEPIVGVRMEVNRHLWLSATRRPCHGQATPSHVFAGSKRTVFVDWERFGLGDPAMEAVVAAVPSTLEGTLDQRQYDLFLDSYAWGMRDLGDEDLSQRIGILASVMPFAVVVESLLAGIPREPAARLALARKLRRALEWLGGSLGVAIDPLDDLLAPLM